MNTTATSPASFTVLVATANRADALRRTLRSLSRLDAAGLCWRVIVVDNASADDTQQVLAELVAGGVLPLTTLYEPGRGKSRALNLGLSCIDRGLVLFVDDDIEVRQDWLRAYAEAEARWPDRGIFGGPIVPVFPPGAPAWVQDDQYVNQSSMFGAYHPLHEQGLTTDLPLGANMAIRREVIGDNRFDERFGPGGDYHAMGCETEFEARLMRQGQTHFVFVPGAQVKHSVRPEQLSRDAVWQRAYKWGRSLALSDPRWRERRRLFGVPLRYGFAAMRAFLRYAPFWLGPRHMNLKYGWQWQVRAGRVRGYLERQACQRRAAQLGL